MVSVNASEAKREEIIKTMSNFLLNEDLLQAGSHQFQAIHQRGNSSLHSQASNHLPQSSSPLNNPLHRKLQYLVEAKEVLQKPVPVAVQVAAEREALQKQAAVVQVAQEKAAQL